MVNEKYNGLEMDELFSNVMMEVEAAAVDFTKTLAYKQLNYKEQQSAVEIISYFGECMFDYHLESMCLWSKKSLEDVLVSVFPKKINGSLSFFEKVESVLVKFLEFLYYTDQQVNGLELMNCVKENNNQMLSEVSVILKDSPEEKLFDLGSEMGMDMSDLCELERLYKFVSLFETTQKKDI